MKVKEAVRQLEKEFDENRNSHVFLVETNDEEKSLDDLKEVISHMIAREDPVVQSQIKNETYLELVILRSEGQTIKNDRILELQDRLKTKPVLSDHIFYIISLAEDMNENSANKLLKTIEEPNSEAIGFLVTKNADLLLPTIKSRCQTINFSYDETEEPKQLSDDVIALAKDLTKAIENRDHIAFYKAKTTDKLLKENAQIVENMIKDYYNMACNLKKAEEIDDDIVEFLKKKNSYHALVSKAKYLNILLTKLTKNVNADLLLEKIFFDLKEVK